MYEWENQDIFKDVPDFPIISRPLGHNSITGLLFICRAGALLPQFKKEHRFDAARTVRALRLMALGLFKLVAVSDVLGLLVDEVLLKQGDAALRVMDRFLPADWQSAAGYIGLMLVLTLALRLGEQDIVNFPGEQRQFSCLRSNRDGLDSFTQIGGRRSVRVEHFYGCC